MRRRIEYGLIIAGLLCLTLFVVSYSRYYIFQQRGQVTRRYSPSKIPIFPKVDTHPVIGHIRIKRLAFSVAMVEGDDDESLELAAGHMPGTASAGRRGNMVVAGHRDSAFWPLRNVREGDRIEVEGDRTAVYRVQQSRVVDPYDTSALADTSDAVLTLVTCYPFRHVGPASQRFIVRATLVTGE